MARGKTRDTKKPHTKTAARKTVTKNRRTASPKRKHKESNIPNQFDQVFNLKGKPPSLEKLFEQVPALQLISDLDRSYAVGQKVKRGFAK
jgi:hypothetical protein